MSNIGTNAPSSSSSSFATTVTTLISTQGPAASHIRKGEDIEEERKKRTPIEGFCCIKPGFINPGQCVETKMYREELEDVFNEKYRKCALTKQGCLQKCEQPKEIQTKIFHYLTESDRQTLKESLLQKNKNVLLDVEYDPLLKLLKDIDHIYPYDDTVDKLITLVIYLQDEYINKKRGSLYSDMIVDVLLTISSYRIFYGRPAIDNKIIILRRYGQQMIEKMHEYKWINIYSLQFQYKIWKIILHGIYLYQFSIHSTTLVFQSLLNLGSIKKWNTELEFKQFIEPVYDEIFIVPNFADNNGSYNVNGTEDDFNESPNRLMVDYLVLMVKNLKPMIFDVLLEQFVIKNIQLPIKYTMRYFLFLPKIKEPFVRKWFPILESHYQFIWNKYSVEIFEKIFQLDKEQIEIYRHADLLLMRKQLIKMKEVIDSNIDRYKYPYGLEYNYDEKEDYGEIPEKIEFKNNKMIPVQISDDQMWTAYDVIQNMIGTIDSLIYFRKLIIPNPLGSYSTTASTSAVVRSDQPTTQPTTSAAATTSALGINPYHEEFGPPRSGGFNTGFYNKGKQNKLKICF